MKIYFFYVTFFGNLIANVYSNGEKKCFGAVKSLTTNCGRRCPSGFPVGTCKLYEGKWQCVCKRFELETNEFSVEEANCILSASNSEQNPECVKELCPPGFRDDGQILVEREEWQWYCIVKEFDNERGSKYTLSEAFHIYGACNGPPIEGIRSCRHLCPDNYKSGDCFLDNEQSIFRCGCANDHKFSDWYGVQETKDIVSVCSATHQVRGGCVLRCPTGFNYGGCYGRGTRRVCGCSQQENGDGFYTISEARQMMKACNSRKQNEECRGLCPEGYKREGKCSNEDGHLECQCMRHNGEWIPLKRAIYEYEANTGRDLQRAHIS